MTNPTLRTHASRPTRRASALAWLRNTCAALLVLPMAACQWSSNQELLVESEPAGATIYVNGIRQGVTPHSVSLSFDDHDRAFLQLLGAGRAPTGLWYTESTVPSEGRVRVTLTRN